MNRSCDDTDKSKFSETEISIHGILSTRFIR